MSCSFGSNSCSTELAGFNESEWLGVGNPAGHLFDALAWLLRAAQEWQIQSSINTDVDGYAVQVYAMDSVMLRSRALFEFFVGQGRNYCHASCLFGLSSQIPGPANFRQWQNEMHIGAMHLQDRSIGGQMMAHDGSGLKDLNRMPVDIAQGVLEVWGYFEQELANLGSAPYASAKTCREKAEEDSRRVVDHLPDRVRIYGKSNASIGKLF